jgi:capsid assembly protease
MEHLKLLTRSAIWAIRPEAVVLAVMQLTGRVQAAEGRWEAARPSTIGKGTSKVGVVPIQGVLTKDGPSWYGSSYDGISSALDQFANDPEVKRIILQVDSPGGEVTGLPETAALLSAIAKVKPVSAIVDGQSASAAFWLTSQANDVTLTPSGEVGSVGVRMMHMDVSKMMDEYGIKVTELHSGDFKTEWSPYKPLSDAAKEDMQPRLDASREEFIGGVAAGRGSKATQDIIDNRFGEGRMFSSSTALNHGLVDKVQSSRDFFRAILPAAEESSNPASPSFPIRRTERELQVRRARMGK